MPARLHRRQFLGLIAFAPLLPECLAARSQTPSPKTYSFTIIPSGVTEITGEMADALFEAGCDDSSPMSRCGVVYVHFNREAATLGDAIGSAVNDVEKAGLAVARIEIDNH